MKIIGGGGWRETGRERGKQGVVRFCVCVRKEESVCVYVCVHIRMCG